MPQENAPSKRKISFYTLIGSSCIVITILLVWFYFGRDRGVEGGQRNIIENIRIANTDYAGTCGVLMAKEKGYFKGEGLNITLESYTTGKAALDAVMKGHADLGTSADLPIMFAGMKHLPIATIATIFVADEDYGIIARKDKGITSPSDLVGKRIGVALTTSAHFALDAFLNRQKFSSTDVKMVDMKPERLADALIKGEIDAASTWEPFLSLLRNKLGENAVMFSTREVYDSIYNLSGRQDYIVKRPETIKKVLRALIKGGQFCRESPAVATEFVAKSIKADPKRLEAAWGLYRFDITLDQGLVLILEDEARWAMKNKLVEESTMPNYLNFIYLDGLKAVSPNAVTIIH